MRSTIDSIIEELFKDNVKVPEKTLKRYKLPINVPYESLYIFKSTLPSKHCMFDELSIQDWEELFRKNRQKIEEHYV
jgi:hypothetical protein